MKPMKLLFICSLFTIVAACANNPPVPNVIAATSHTIGAMAVEVGNAQKLGYITVAQESVLLDKLSQANSDLRLAESAYASCAANTPCTSSDSLLKIVDALLTEVRAQLPRPQLEGTQ